MSTLDPQGHPECSPRSLNLTTHDFRGNSKYPQGVHFKSSVKLKQFTQTAANYKVWEIFQKTQIRVKKSKTPAALSSVLDNNPRQCSYFFERSKNKIQMIWNMKYSHKHTRSSKSSRNKLKFFFCKTSRRSGRTHVDAKMKSCKPSNCTRPRRDGSRASSRSSVRSHLSVASIS